MNNNKLGTYLQSLRKQQNYTQAFVAQKIGVIRQTYSHYETGRVCPPIAVLCQLADFYEIPVESLLDAADVSQQEEKQKNESLYQLSKSEQELIRLHRQLDERGQEDIMALIAMLAEKNRNRPPSSF